MFLEGGVWGAGRTKKTSIWFERSVKEPVLSLGYVMKRPPGRVASEKEARACWQDRCGLRVKCFLPRMARHPWGAWRTSGQDCRWDEGREVPNGLDLSSPGPCKGTH